MMAVVHDLAEAQGAIITKTKQAMHACLPSLRWSFPFSQSAISLPERASRKPKNADSRPCVSSFLPSPP
jgi:hypothetical protein